MIIQNNFIKTKKNVIDSLRSKSSKFKIYTNRKRIPTLPKFWLYSTRPQRPPLAEPKHIFSNPWPNPPLNPNKRVPRKESLISTSKQNAKIHRECFIAMFKPLNFYEGVKMWGCFVYLFLCTETLETKEINIEKKGGIEGEVFGEEDGGLVGEEE